MERYMNRDLILAVRELLDRHLDLYEIASRLKVDVTLIQQILDVLS
jgi:hypothetical protein